MELKAAVTDREVVIAAPEWVERFDAKRGEDEAVGDRLAVRAETRALDRDTRPQRGDDFVGRVVGFDLVGDDRVGG